MSALRIHSPINYWGGKHSIAPLVWSYLGNPDVYIEPFFGSGAVLLDRPHEGRYETVNDIDPLVCNMHRALKFDPDGVAYYADDVIDEADLHSKGNVLMARREFLNSLLRRDPEFFDIKLAGYYAWMMGLIVANTIKTKPKSQRNGIHAFGYAAHLYENFRDYAKRMRGVRVLCGDWKRAVTSAEYDSLGVAGIFLDPPYAGTEYVYGDNRSVNVAHEVREWCIANGENPNMRIVLAGHLEHASSMPTNWSIVPWKRNGGYGNQADGVGRANAELERLYCSPFCEDPSSGQASLFDLPGAA